MKPLPHILLTLVAVGLALFAYDALRGAPREGGTGALDVAALETRVEDLAAQARALEDKLVNLRLAASAESAPPPPEAEGIELSTEELDRLEAVVREIERRKEIDRLTRGVEARLAALGLEWVEGERARAAQLLVRFEAERADFWREVQQQSITDKAEIARRFAPIRERCEASLRNALPAARAQVLVEAFLGS